MQVFSNKISETTLDIFRKHHEMFANDKKLNDINSHNIDIRTLMEPGTSAFEEVRKICNNHFSPDATLYANYQRQTNPTEMHVDEWGAYRTEPTHTIIIPLHTDPRLGVVIFKEIFNTNQDFIKFLQNYPYETKTKSSNISEQYALQHTPTNFRNGDYLVDFMELDGVFQYNLGDYVLFDTNQVHVSIDFKGYPEYKVKNLVQIHIGQSTGKGYNPFIKSVN